MSLSIPSLRRALPGTVEALILFLVIMMAPSPASAASITVAPGDTLAGIAGRHGVSVASLAAANGIRNPNVIVVGAHLTLPGSGATASTGAAATGGGVHTVRAGETLAGIASRYGVTATRLAAVNSIANPNLVREGTRLSIPGSGTARTVPAVAVAGSPGVHVVRTGDTLGAIAARYGVGVTALARENGLSNPNVVPVGTRLRVPGRAVTQTVAVTAPAGVHRVVAGDTVGSIAARYGTTAARVASLNGLANPSLITIGQSLRVPGSTTTSSGQGAYIGARTVPSAEVVALINNAAVRYGVDPALARAVAYQESGFNHNVRSHAGAVGTMQLMPATAQWVGPLLVGRTLNPYSVRDNVDGGVAYLAWLQRRTPSSRHAVAGYYQGLNALRARGMFDDTKAYVRSVMAHYGTV